MDVVRTIKPGDKGSLRFLKQYGEQLVAVRYRKQGRQRLTTIEVIVERRERKMTQADFDAIDIHPPGQVVALRINFNETEWQEKIKQAGGSWDRKHKVWHLIYRNAVALGLKDRIVSPLEKSNQL